MTGSSGFIGQHLVPYLQSQGWEVTTWQGDVRMLAGCTAKVEVVLHLAAVVRSQQFAAAPHEAWDVNVGGTLAALNYCQRVGARCVLTSTSGIYQGHTDATPGPRNGGSLPQSSLQPQQVSGRATVSPTGIGLASACGVFTAV
ncbi:hypothetical protein DO97_01550 [Neosynechococcus sphagnicola sy1]|uniref:NAD-dependent epimerase/dehydratase domain-containing protein n=1 Tax=Neosynechococcus sphagnicola sy1 TaxID=1497020 RepID=A0A098TLT1_9CYAN|nr:hypothetical protein DO97_01550 [Neosynechococcus sphagnicola sy1]